MMRRRLFFSLLFVPLLGWAQQTPQSMTLDECVSYAMTHSPQVNVSSLDRRIADARIKETRAIGLPQINGRVNYTDNLQIQQQIIPNFLAPAVYQVLQAENLANPPQNGGNFGTIPVAFGTKHSAVASVGVNQLIFDGSYFVGLQASHTYKTLTEQQFQQAKRDVTEGVEKAFYQVLVSEKRLGLVESNMQRLDSLMKETKAMYDNGFAEKLDYQRVKVNYNNIKVTLNNTRNMVDLGYKALKMQMGMDVETPLKLEGSLDDLDFNEDLVAADSIAYQNRIEFKINRTNQRLTSLDMKNNKSQYLPKLNADLNLGYNTGVAKFNDLFDGQQWYDFASVGVTLSIPIFDGLAKSARIQKNKAQLLQLEEQRKMLKNSISLETDRAKTDLENALENLQVQKDNMQLARDIYQQAKARYQQGLGSNLEVTNADTSRKEAETNYYNALYKAIVAKIDLEKALGKLK